MAALSAVRGAASVGFHQQGPSEKEIREARREVIDFVKSDDAGEFVGTLIDLATALKRIYDDNGNDRDEAYKNGIEVIFSELLEQAGEKNHLPKASPLFSNDLLDRVAFVDELAREIIALGQEEVERVGEFVPASEEAVEAAAQDLLTFIRSDLFGSISKCDLAAFRQKLGDIGRRPHVDELQPYLENTQEGPGYSKLFADLIQDAELSGCIDTKTRDIYFAPNFNQIAFLKRIIQQI